MVGIPGARKSFFAERFAETFRSPLVSYDKICQLVNGSLTDPKLKSAVCAQITNYMLDEFLKAGQTIIYDGTSTLRGERDGLVRRANTAGYSPILIWVQTEAASAKKRALKGTDSKIPLTAEQFDAVLKRFSPPNHEKHIVISGKHTYASQMKIVLKYLVEPVDKDRETPPSRTSRYLSDTTSTDRHAGYSR